MDPIPENDWVDDVATLNASKGFAVDLLGVAQDVEAIGYHQEASTPRARVLAVHISFGVLWLDPFHCVHFLVRQVFHDRLPVRDMLINGKYVQCCVQCITTFVQCVNSYFEKIFDKDWTL